MFAQIQCSECGSFIHKESEGYCCQYCGHIDYEPDYLLVKQELIYCDQDERRHLEQQIDKMIEECYGS